MEGPTPSGSDRAAAAGEDHRRRTRAAEVDAVFAQPMAVEIQRDRFSGDIGPRVKIIRQQRNDAVVCRAVKGLAHRHIVFRRYPSDV